MKIPSFSTSGRFGAYQRAIASILLIIQASLMAYGSARLSPTWDEIPHLSAGLSHWLLGRFDLYSVNPPLVRMVATLPLVACNARTDWNSYSSVPSQRSEFEVGKDFITANVVEFGWYFTMARWACLPFAAVGGVVCWLWAKRLYGDGAGLLAVSLWCTCPNILAYGFIITPDLGATSLGVFSGYAYWRWLRRPTWNDTLLAGFILGLAELTKAVWVILFILWPVLLVLWLAFLPDRPARKEVRSRFAKLATIITLALIVLNAGYGLEGTMTSLGNFRFCSKALRGELTPYGSLGNRFEGTALKGVPVPLPKNYVLGIDVQKKDFESGLWSYFRGDWQQHGWPEYYIYALAIKTPISTISLLIISIITLPILRRIAQPTSTKPSREGTSDITWRDEFILLAHPVVLFVFISIQTGFSHHIRYIIPVIPQVFIWVSRIALLARPHTLNLPWIDRVGRLGHFARCGSRSMVSLLIIALLCWSAFDNYRIFPHELSYFNQLVGGTKNGHLYLGNSNTDWGQSLYYVLDWYKRHPTARPLHLGYDVPILDPRILGIDSEPIPPGPVMNRKGYPKTPNWPWKDVAAAADQGTEGLDAKRWTSQLGPLPGWFIISVNQIHSRDGTFEYFQEFEPVEIIGHTMNVYNISTDEANRVRTKFSLPSVPDR